MFLEKPEAFIALALIILVICGLAFHEVRVQHKILKELDASRRGVIWKVFQKSLLIFSSFVIVIFLIASPKLKGESLGAGSMEEISFVFDNTKSMDARKTPASPSRLDRSKDIGLSILDDLKFVDASICSFGGTTNCLVPPSLATGDKKILRGVIEDFIVPDSTFGKGSNIIGSLKDMAEELTTSYESSLPTVIVFTDGEETISPDPEDLRYIKDSKVLFILVGVGEREGAKIPKFSTLDGRFIERYETFGGNDYVSYLNESYLKKLANDIGGKYFFEEDRHKITSFLKDNLAKIDKQSKQFEYSQVVYETPRYIEISSMVAVILLLVVFVRKYVF